MSNTADAEQERYPVYLDTKRNWHAREIGAQGWEIDHFSLCGKVFFLSDGRIGMEYAGRVIVRSIELWMSPTQEAPDE